MLSLMQIYQVNMVGLRNKTIFKGHASPGTLQRGKDYKLGSIFLYVSQIRVVLHSQWVKVHCLLWGRVQKGEQVGWVITEDLITWSLVTSLLPLPAKSSTDQTLVGNSLSHLASFNNRQLMSWSLTPWSDQLISCPLAEIISLRSGTLLQKGRLAFSNLLTLP